MLSSRMPFLLVIACLLIAGPALAGAPEWAAVANEETVYVITTDEDGDVRETKIWLLVLDDVGYIRTSRGTGALPPTGSILETDQPAMIVSTVKLAEDDDGLVARLYNIANEPVEGRVRLNAPAASSQIVNLNEEDPSPAPSDDGWLPLSLKRNEIATLKYNHPFRSS